MKKFLYGAALALATLTSCGPDKETLRIKSSLEGFTGDTILVMAASHQDTILMKDGKFEADLKFTQVENFLLLTPTAQREPSNQVLQLLAVPGETLELTGDLNGEYQVGGTAYYRQYREAEEALKPAVKAYNDFEQALTRRMEQGESQENIMEEYMAQAPALQQKITEATMAFIKEHPDYDCSAQLLTSLLDFEDMKKAEALLSERVRTGRMKAYYRGVMDEVEAQEEAARSQAPGTQAPDFTLNDLNGKPLALSSLRGKHVLIDFWGNWCGWCIKGFPQLKEYYAKYPGKFEILGVDCNDTEETWKEAVKKHGLPWKHVYNTPESGVLEQYKVSGFPTKILIDPQGKIVKSVVGEDPSFFHILDELFGQ